MWDLLWGALKRSLLDLNFLYYTMGVLSVGALLGATALMRRGGRLDPSSRFARWVARVRTSLPAIVVLSVTTLAAGLQGGFERQVQAWHGWDFTPLAWAVEGNLVERFQDAARSPALDALFVTVYTAGAFLLYFIPFYTLVAMGRGRSALRVAVTMAGIWAVGIVFYFFFPVYEVWVTAGEPYGYGQVENVLFERLPSARESDAYWTAINNNFPSLHVALSCGIATALWLARERWLAVPSTAVATGVAIATMYLGIHWAVDVVAGLALAGGAAWLAHRRVPLQEEVPGAAVEPDAAVAVSVSAKMP